jgi:type I restriction enzyme S subunit
VKTPVLALDQLHNEVASVKWPLVAFSELFTPNRRPYTLGPTEDANLVGMRLYGQGPFHREFKPATKIRKKTHFTIKTGDVIYNKLFAWKGAFGVVPPGLDGMFVSDKYPTYQHDPSRVDLDYLKWYFRYPPLWEQAYQMSTGSAALSKLTLNPPRFMDLVIPLPPLAEQKRVAKKIEHLASRVSEAHVLRRKSSREADSLIRSRLREIGERLPHNGTLEHVLSGKPRNGWSAKCDNAEGGIAVLTLGAVTGYEYDPEAIKRTSMATDSTAHYWLQEGDLLITRSNTPALVGHAAVYTGTPSPCIYPDLMMRVPVDAALASTRFVWYWLQTPQVREYILANAKGTSSTMKKISQGVVMGIPFPHTLSNDEQREIVHYLDSLQVKAEHLKSFQKMTAVELDALLPSILDRAFKGEL